MVMIKSQMATLLGDKKLNPITVRVFGETGGTVRALAFWFSLLFIWFCAPVNPCETEAC